MNARRPARSTPTLEQLSKSVGFDRSPHTSGLGAQFGRRTFSQWLNDWAAHRGLFARLGDWLGKQLLHDRPRLGSAVFLATATAGSGYLWAMATGHGLHGALSGSKLDNASTMPDANVAAIAAMLLAVVGWMLFSVTLDTTLRREHGWLTVGATGATVVLTGLAAFAITQAIWHY